MKGYLSNTDESDGDDTPTTPQQGVLLKFESTTHSLYVYLNVIICGILVLSELVTSIIFTD